MAPVFYLALPRTACPRRPTYALLRYGVRPEDEGGVRKFGMGGLDSDGRRRAKSPRVSNARGRHNQGQFA